MITRNKLWKTGEAVEGNSKAASPVFLIET